MVPHWYDGIFKLSHSGAEADVLQHNYVKTMFADTLDPWVARLSQYINNIEHNILYILHLEYILQTRHWSPRVISMDVFHATPLHKAYSLGMPVCVLSM